MKHLPDFNIDSYEQVLLSLKKNSYQFRTINEMKNSYENKTCYLRHDIDIHLYNIDKISTIECKLGIKATYFILLTSTYNILEPSNRRIIEKIISQGHEIGLHYDLMEYPISDFSACESKLLLEVNLLENTFKIKISSIVMHQPHTGMPDVFKENSKYIHPHNPRWQSGMAYISDSCRAWRDETLLNCFGENSPKVLQINLHPEVWLGTELNRIEFLNNTLYNNMCIGADNMLETIKKVWPTHVGLQSHDKRVENA
jgi:hypothetical protein